MFQYLVFAGALANILGGLVYIKTTIRGNTKPNRVTWFLWSTAPLIASAAAVSAGVGWAALPVFMSGFVPLMVFVASFINSNAYWKLEKFDYLCGFFSVLALILWGITKQPVIAIIFAIVSDGFAAVPTLVKSWGHPETESSAAYSTGLFNALTSFTAIKMWGFSELSYPIYLVIINTLLLLAVYNRRIFKFRG